MHNQPLLAIVALILIYSAGGPVRGQCDQWHPFTSGGQVGVSDTVRSLTVWNGDLIAGGTFASAGGQVVNYIARWDGQTWHPLTSGGETGVNIHLVYDLTVYEGDLVAGGQFTTAGGQTVNRIARWDGVAWHPITSGGQIGVDFAVRSLTLWNGDLIAGGHFTTAGGQTVNRIARWDGSAWHPFTSGGQVGVNGSVDSMMIWNDDLVVGGNLTTAGGQTVNYIARWDGLAWHPFASGGQTGFNSNVLALAEWNGDLVAGGYFTTAGGQTVNRIARWDGTTWQPFVSGGHIGIHAGTYVSGLTVWNNDLIAGGRFLSAGGQTVSRIARWDGSTWHPFVSNGQNGVSGGATNPFVWTMTVWNSDLIIGGDFGMAGGQTMNDIARLSCSQTPGDFDMDGDVDLDDFNFFQMCLAGPESPPAESCPQGVDSDLDADGDVDLRDFWIFQANFVGS